MRAAKSAAHRARGDIVKTMTTGAGVTARSRLRRERPNPHGPEDAYVAPGTAGRRWALALIAWYDSQKRQLPWRETRDPYRIWVSEVMLQQTQVATVLGYYERWMQRFPTLQALAVADVADVLRAWEGLGYYSRARNLQRAALQVVADHAGQVPRTVPELLRLPGIGPYSAGAIASIAFGADEPVVDGNIIRVLTRAFGLPGDPKRAPLARGLWRLARSLMPIGRARDFNQALMELGATCCTPRAPRCAACPVAQTCVALAQDRVLDFPESAPRPAPTEVIRAAALIRRRSRFLTVQAPEEALRWAGMWQFPDAQIAESEAPAAALSRSVRASTGLDISVGALVANIRHQVTRFRISIQVYACTAEGRALPIQYRALRWCTPAELAALAMPAAHRRIARTLA
jgi:A/G-specific adenine glycosylase